MLSLRLQGHEDVLWCCLLLAVYINSADPACDAGCLIPAPPPGLETTQNSVYALDVLCVQETLGNTV